MLFLNNNRFLNIIEFRNISNKFENIDENKDM